MGASSGIPPVRFAEARGARLAFQTIGEGPDVVAIPPTAQNIEVAWEWPHIREMLELQARFCRWTMFDKRGTGASDRRSEQPGLDERVEDLRAVMDSAGIERAFLYGASEGGPTCIMFAVTYPERVDGLILHGTGARTSAPVPPEQYDDFKRRLHEYTSKWGTPDSTVVDGFAPSIADVPGYREWHQRYERLAATQDSLAELIEISTMVDVSEVLDQVDVPTLVLHNTGDQIIPVHAARDLARGIENAQLIEYPSDDHFAYSDLAFVDDIERFVTGSVSERPRARRVPEAVEIVTLGSFVVRRNGVDVPNSEWGSRRARQLLKRLVAARGWPVSREELFEQLWPGETDLGKLGPRLSVQLSAVRKVLGGGVHATRSAVSLDLDAVAVDVEALFGAATDADIVRSFTGDFCPGDVDEPWSNGVRDEARSRFAAAVYRLAESPRADSGSADALEAALRQLIALDRWDDRANRTLVEHLVSVDRIADARRAHEAWSASMAEIDASVEPFDRWL